jgi:hypothetical protein
MVQLAATLRDNPRSPSVPAPTAVRRLRVDRQGLIYDPRPQRAGPSAARPDESFRDRTDAASLLASILDSDEELATAWDDRRLFEAIFARSLGAGEGPDSHDPFAAGRDLVATLESRLGAAACRAIDLGIVDIGDDLEPCLAAHLGGDLDSLRRLVRKAFAPFEISRG